MRFKRMLVLVLFSAVLFVFACDPGDFPFPPDEDLARVMVIHASPDAPPVDVLLDDELFAESLEFPNNTRYTSLDAGTHNVKVNVANTDNTVIEADLDLLADTYYSVFACNVVANIEPLVLVDDFSDPGLEHSLVRFVHLSPDAPAVDVTLTDGTVLFGNVTFKGATDYKLIDVGLYDLQVRLAGTEDVVLELDDVVLGPKVIYTIWAKGLVDGQGDQALGAEIIWNKIKF